MYYIWHQNAQNCVGFWGSAPDPEGGAYDASPYPLVVRGFLPSAIAASRLRRSQFHLPHSDILVGPPTSGPWLRPCCSPSILFIRAHKGSSINYVNKIGGGGLEKFDCCWQGEGGVWRKLTSTNFFEKLKKVIRKF